MPKKIRDMSAIEVKRMSAPGMYAVGGVTGLYLAVQKSGSKSWILRCVIGEKRREMGLGGYPSVTLEMAREKARAFREQIFNNDHPVDPIEQRREAKAALIAAQRATKKILFKDASIKCHSKMLAEFKNIKHAAQWIQTLKTYAFPAIGDLYVDAVDMSHIQSILDPIWETKTETATRVRQRLEAVLSWSTVSGYRSGDNPARWTDHLDQVYGSPAKIKKLKGDGHHAAMPYKEIPAFMSYLRRRQGIAARALEFTILTATRSGEVREAVWSEVDIKEKVWVIPASRMKAGKEHRVPLSDASIDLLKRTPRFIGTDYIFPSTQKKVPLTSSGLQMHLKNYNPEYTTHGMRSAFRDWISEETQFQNIVAEMALAHTIKNAVEAAYRRGDLFDKRVELMTAWSEYCGSHVGGQVVHFSK